MRTKRPDHNVQFPYCHLPEHKAHSILAPKKSFSLNVTTTTATTTMATLTTNNRIATFLSLCAQQLLTGHDLICPIFTWQHFIKWIESSPFYRDIEIRWSEKCVNFVYHEKLNWKSFERSISSVIFYLWFYAHRASHFINESKCEVFVFE